MVGWVRSEVKRREERKRGHEKTRSDRKAPRTQCPTSSSAAAVNEHASGAFSLELLEKRQEGDVRRHRADEQVPREIQPRDPPVLFARQRVLAGVTTDTRPVAAVVCSEPACCCFPLRAVCRHVEGWDVLAIASELKWLARRRSVDDLLRRRRRRSRCRRRRRRRRRCRRSRCRHRRPRHPDARLPRRRRWKRSRPDDTGSQSGELHAYACTKQPLRALRHGRVR
eukprot:6198216-Pleurochrysis_carterae.AAC.2